MKYITDENLLAIRSEAFQRCLTKHGSDTQFTSYKTIVFLNDWITEIKSLILDPLYNEALNEETFNYFKHPYVWHNDLNVDDDNLSVDDADDTFKVPISKFNLAKFLYEKEHITLDVFKVVQVQLDSYHAYELSKIVFQFEKEKYDRAFDILFYNKEDFKEFITYFVEHYEFKANLCTRFGFCRIIKTLYNLKIMSHSSFIYLNNLLEFGGQMYEPDSYWFPVDKAGWIKRLILFNHLVKTYDNYLAKTNYYTAFTQEEQKQHKSFYKNL